jgi:hypothetical protein
MPSEQRTFKNAPGELMMSGLEDAARTLQNGEPIVPLRPGVFVAVPIGSEGNGEGRLAVLPVSAASVIIGVVKKWIYKDIHPPKDQIAVYHRGYVGVWVAVAVKAHDPVFAVFTPGNTQGFGTNAAGANAVVVNSARFVSTTPANEVAIVSLLLP